MNDTIKKLDEKFIAKIEYEQELQEPEEMRIITRNALHARDTALVRAIAEAVKTETEAKMAQGKYTYAHEVAEDAVEIINSFGGQNGNKDKD
jgi:hypothetical protein